MHDCFSFAVFLSEAFLSRAHLNNIFWHAKCSYNENEGTNDFGLSNVDIYNMVVRYRLLSFSFGGTPAK